MRFLYLIFLCVIVSACDEQKSKQVNQQPCCNSGEEKVSHFEDKKTVEDSVNKWARGRAINNPGQIWGGKNSTFRNPNIIFSAPPNTPINERPPAQIPEGAKALQDVFFATNRKVEGSDLTLASITAERSLEVRYGLAIVSVPKAHTIGVMNRPNSWFFGLIKSSETNEHDFRIQKLQALSRDQFIDGLKFDSDSILLFVHGYNVPFQDAIFKAAQIAYDAQFGGTVLVFSWPSAANPLKYDYDRESANFSPGDLLDLLRVITQEVHKKKIFLLAHSLGNQIVVDALQQAALSKVNLGISELVLAAPDIDKSVFARKAKEIKAVAGNVTIYASGADKALLVSDMKAWGDRVGYVEKDGLPNLFDGIETIDVTAAGDDMLGLNHSTFSNNAVVINDLGRLIVEERHEAPGVRTPIFRYMPDRQNPKYWMYPRAN